MALVRHRGGGATVPSGFREINTTSRVKPSELQNLPTGYLKCRRV